MKQFKSFKMSFFVITSLLTLSFALPAFAGGSGMYIPEPPTEDSIFGTLHKNHRVHPYFSRREGLGKIDGAAAFDRIIDMITDEKTNSLKISIYSFSNARVEKALRELSEKIKTGEHQPVEVKIIIWKKKKAKLNSYAQPWVKLGTKFEKMGFQVKVSPKTLHQKFIIVNNFYLENGSGNLSSGAELMHNDDFFFTKSARDLVRQYIREFSLLWNVSKDFHPEAKPEKPAVADVPSIEMGFGPENEISAIEFAELSDPEREEYVQGVVQSVKEYVDELNAIDPNETVAKFFASPVSEVPYRAFFTSHNHKYKVWAQTDDEKKEAKRDGARLKRFKKKYGPKGNTHKPWHIRNMINNHILPGAQKSIIMAAAHFNSKQMALTVVPVLVDAVDRGIDFRAMFDQREHAEREGEKYYSYHLADKLISLAEKQRKAEEKRIAQEKRLKAEEEKKRKEEEEANKGWITKMGEKIFGKDDEATSEEKPVEEMPAAVKPYDPPLRFPVYSTLKDHFAYQNHHKFILTDASTPENALLMTGSYNFSKTSETENFENTTVFRGEKFTNLFNAYSYQFERVYAYNRPEGRFLIDMPKPKLEEILPDFINWYADNKKEETEDIFSEQPMAGILEDLSDDNQFCIHFERKRTALSYLEYKKFEKLLRTQAPDKGAWRRKLWDYGKKAGSKGLAYLFDSQSFEVVKECK